MCRARIYACTLKSAACLIKGDGKSLVTSIGRKNATLGGSMLTFQRSSNLRLFALVFALVVGLAIALGAMLSAAQAAPVGKLTQFKVPTDNSQPRDITVGSDGNLWFTEGNEVFTPGPDPDEGGTFHRNVGRITPTGEITEFRIEDGIGPNECFCLLNDIVQGPGDVLYFTTNNPGLGRITTDGEILPFVAPDNSAANGSGIAAHGDVWFSARFVPQGVGELDPDTNVVREFSLTDNPGPQDIAASPDGSVWFTQTTEGNIARITDAGIVTEGKVVRNSEPFGITVAPNGNPWYTMMSANKIARLTPN